MVVCVCVPYNTKCSLSRHMPKLGSAEAQGCFKLCNGQLDLSAVDAPWLQPTSATATSNPPDPMCDSIIADDRLLPTCTATAITAGITCIAVSITGWSFAGTHVPEGAYCRLTTAG